MSDSSNHPDAVARPQDARHQDARPQPGQALPSGAVVQPTTTDQVKADQRAEARAQHGARPARVPHRRHARRTWRPRRLRGVGGGLIGNDIGHRGAATAAANRPAQTDLRRRRLRRFRDRRQGEGLLLRSRPAPDVTLHKTVGDEDSKAAVGSGQYDASSGIFYSWLKPVEEGQNVKFVAGLHGGCLRLIVPKDSSIDALAQLKGVNIGIPSLSTRRPCSSPWTSWTPASTRSPKRAKCTGRCSTTPCSPTRSPQGRRRRHRHQRPHRLPAAAARLRTGARQQHDRHERPGLLLLHRPQRRPRRPRDPARAQAHRGVGPGLPVLPRVGHEAEVARIEVDKGYVAGDVGLIETLLKSYTWEPSVVKLKDSLLPGIEKFQKTGYSAGRRPARPRRQGLRHPRIGLVMVALTTQPASRPAPPAAPSVAEQDAERRDGVLAVDPVVRSALVRLHRPRTVEPPAHRHRGRPVGRRRAACRALSRRRAPSPSTANGRRWRWRPSSPSGWPPSGRWQPGPARRPGCRRPGWLGAWAPWWITLAVALPRFASETGALSTPPYFPPPGQPGHGGVDGPRPAGAVHRQLARAAGRRPVLRRHHRPGDRPVDGLVEAGGLLAEPDRPLHRPGADARVIPIVFIAFPSLVQRGGVPDRPDRVVPDDRAHERGHPVGSARLLRRARRWGRPTAS